MPRSRRYQLTRTAEKDFRRAKQWSISRWGESQTKQYFIRLHEAAEYIAQNHRSLAKKDYLASETGLGVYGVGEHYMIYLPDGDKGIIIVALIRQVRDVPEILRKNQYRIRREVNALKNT